MTDNAPNLADYARRMKSLVEEDVRVAADLRELAKEMRETGFQAAPLKALVKALVLAEEGNEKPLERLKARVQDVAIYASALGIEIEGFGERNRFVVNNSDDPAPSRPVEEIAADIEHMAATGDIPGAHAAVTVVRALAGRPARDPRTSEIPELPPFLDRRQVRS